MDKSIQSVKDRKTSIWQLQETENITIKTNKLTSKKVGSIVFKEIYAKANIKVPKTKLKTYKKLLKAKGVRSKAKIKK